jgi:uncharacterized membrane protein (DUF2068 family)
MQAIAVFEASKGLAALAAAVGVLELLHQDVHQLALALLWRFHLAPDAHYPALLLRYADLLGHLDLRSAAPLALAYIALRWLEAYGLWRDRPWAQWLGVLSGALYVPLELAHLLHRPSLIHGGVLLANLALVAFLALQLRQRRRRAPAIE